MTDKTRLWALIAPPYRFQENFGLCGNCRIVLLSRVVLCVWL